MELYPRHGGTRAMPLSMPRWRTCRTAPPRKAGVASGSARRGTDPQLAGRTMARAAASGTRRARHIGLWRPTPPRNQAAMLPQWRYVTPFAIPGTRDFLPAIPPALDQRRLHRGVQRGQGAGPSRRQYANRGSDRHRPVLGRWSRHRDAAGPLEPHCTDRLAPARSCPADNARLFALLNITLADAAILCWEGKFGFSYWRPITAIHEADRDGNPDTAPDRTWDCLLTTPPFPDLSVRTQHLQRRRRHGSGALFRRPTPFPSASVRKAGRT